MNFIVPQEITPNKLRYVTFSQYMMMILVTAVETKLLVGGDDLTHAAEIRTRAGTTN